MSTGPAAPSAPDGPAAPDAPGRSQAAVIGGGTRVAWEELPAEVRSAVEGVCGAPVVAAETQPGGFSPGVAARVRCADGSRHFVKAVSAAANADAPVMHRREAETLATLDPFIAAGALPAARLRGTAEVGPWVAVVLTDIDGHLPRLPWRETDLRQVLTALELLAVAVNPAPDTLPTFAAAHAGVFTGWRSLAAEGLGARLDPWSRAHLDDLADLEASWEAHVTGSCLVHSDVRADNLLLTPADTRTANPVTPADTRTGHPLTPADTRTANPVTPADTRTGHPLTADAAAHDPLTPAGVWFVDWAHACRGAPFVDVVLMAPSVAMQGGPEPADLMAMAPTARGADQAALAALVCALAGYFTERSLRPPPPGLPTVRAFQAAQGEITRPWLASLR